MSVAIERAKNLLARWLVQDMREATDELDERRLGPLDPSVVWSEIAHDKMRTTLMNFATRYRDDPDAAEDVASYLVEEWRHHRSHVNWHQVREDLESAEREAFMP